MFTGIVQDVGSVQALEPRAGDMRLTVRVGRLPLARLALGDSIAVAGVCLTVVQLDPAQGCFSADVSRETLALTTLGAYREGRQVNLEPALRAGDALGGHLVIGHVDGVGEVRERRGDARSELLRISAPPALGRYLARKGSVTVDGVSLTLNEVGAEQFTVNLVPHTLAVTTLAALAVGERVNLEIDVIARYVERLISAAS